MTAPGRDEPLIRLEGLEHRFPGGEEGRPALAVGRLEVGPGELVMLTGPSGSGKTTLLTLVGGLRTVQQGSTRVLGHELNPRLPGGLDAAGLVRLRRELGFIFQAHNLLDSLTAAQNVRMALQLNEHDPRAAEARAAELLTGLGLGDRLHYKPGKLSGGQKQRVAIARALAHRPRLILADEPTAALDPDSGARVMQELGRCVDRGASVLIVTHDNRILDYAHRIIDMVDGTIRSDDRYRPVVLVCLELLKCKAFSRMAVGELAQVALRMTRETFRAGETIIRQGERGDKFYVLRAGSVKVVLDAGKPTQREKPVPLKAPDHFGEIALLHDVERTASVVALEDVETFVLSRANFQTAIRAGGVMQSMLKRGIDERVRQLEGLLAGQAHETPKAIPNFFPTAAGPKGEEPLIRLEGLEYRFPGGEEGRPALAVGRLEVGPGELVMLTGPSGSGKTTLLTLAGGLRTVQQGSARVLGHELNPRLSGGLDAAGLVRLRRELGFIFQAHNLLDSLTANQNVRMALQLHDAPNPVGLGAKLLTALGLGNRLGYKPGKLSGGQKQRVAIARALAHRPRLILADEPTAALDPDSSREVLERLAACARQGASVLIVTHDNRILKYAHRIIDMVDGQVASDVPVDPVCRDLLNCRAFARMSVDALAELAKKMTRETFRPGQAIIRQGERGDKFYVLRRGSAKVILNLGKPTQREVEKPLRPFDYFGEIALLHAVRRTASVVALEECEVYVLGKGDFLTAVFASESMNYQLRRALTLLLLNQPRGPGAPSQSPIKPGERGALAP